MYFGYSFFGIVCVVIINFYHSSKNPISNKVDTLWLPCLQCLLLVTLALVHPWWLEEVVVMLDTKLGLILIIIVSYLYLSSFLLFRTHFIISWKHHPSLAQQSNDQWCPPYKRLEATCQRVQYEATKKQKNAHIMAIASVLLKKENIKVTAPLKGNTRDDLQVLGNYLTSLL